MFTPGDAAHLFAGQRQEARYAASYATCAYNQVALFLIVCIHIDNYYKKIPIRQVCNLRHKSSDFLFTTASNGGLFFQFQWFFFLQTPYSTTYYYRFINLTSLEKIDFEAIILISYICFLDKGTQLIINSIHNWYETIFPLFVIRICALSAVSRM